MRNWQELVRQRLAGLELDAAEKEEVHSELAAHLEESYEIFRKKGLLESEATRLTLGQVSDWQELRRGISAAKRREHPTRKRVRQLWVPGFLTFLLSVLFLITLQKVGFRPRIVGNGPNAILFYVPWLAALPFTGALGAYLSCRAGGSREIALLASLFPTLALTATFVLMFPIDLIIEPLVGNHLDFGIVASAMLKEGVSWRLVPGTALFLGGLVVGVLFSQGPTSRSSPTGSETTHA